MVDLNLQLRGLENKMKYELNDYHRNISDEELLSDVKKTAANLGKTTLTAKEYAKNGKYHNSTLVRRFGSWKKVLEICNLEIKGHPFKYDFSDEDVITDLKRVANMISKNTITRDEYNKYGTYHGNTLEKHYGSWNNVLRLAGFENNLNRNFTNEEMFDEIERIWILLGRQPTSTDIKNGISKFSLNSYARRFGGWRGALSAFVEYINDEKILVETENNIDNSYISSLQNPEQTCNSKYFKHKTSREPNLRLRFKVMQRDDFKCCICGASPAKNSSVELVLDHVVPWDKGGETTYDNLQTLCKECNLGKSDL